MTISRSVCAFATTVIVSSAALYGQQAPAQPVAAPAAPAPVAAPEQVQVPAPARAPAPQATPAPALVTAAPLQAPVVQAPPVPQAPPQVAAPEVPAVTPDTSAQQVPVPAVVAEQPAPDQQSQPDLMLESEEHYKQGIDTVEQEDSGNWYEKRKSWKKARTKYDQIRKLTDQVESMLKDFTDKRKSIAQVLEEFYVSFAADREAVVEHIDRLIEQLEKEVQTAPEQLSIEESKQLDQVRKQKKEDLEKVKAEFAAVRKADAGLRDAVLSGLVEQIERARSYEERALEAYYKISEILDDQKARSLLHDMDNYADNIQAIAQWIQNDLRSYVDKSIVTLKNLIESIQTGVTRLKSQSIDLQTHLNQEEKQAQELVAKQKLEAERLQAERAKALAAAQAHKGWWSKLTNFFYDMWSGVKSRFYNLYTKLFGTQTVPKAPQLTPTTPGMSSSGTA